VESSRILAAPGLRTPARLGWRAGLATSFTIAIASNRLWTLGMVSFCLRGGILLLTLPIIVLPTQVEFRLILGNYLGSTGFTGSFYGLLAMAAVLAAVATVAVLLVLARNELSSFEVVVNDPVVAEHSPYRPLPVVGAARRRIWLRLLAVQVLTFIALIGCAAPVVWSVVETSYSEVTLPSSTAPIYERVLAGVGEQLFFLLIAIIIIEMIGALTSRELLVRAYGWRETPPSSRRLWLLPALGAALSQPFRAPVRTLGTSLVAWTLTAGTALLVVWALSLAWAAVRGAFLTAVGLADLGDDVQMVLTGLLLALVFAFSLGLGGFVSALRATLWSVDRLR